MILLQRSKILTIKLALIALSSTLSLVVSSLNPSMSKLAFSSFVLAEFQSLDKSYVDQLLNAVVRAHAVEGNSEPIPNLLTPVRT